MRRLALALGFFLAALPLAWPAQAQLSKPRRDPFVHVAPPRPAPVTPAPYVLPAGPPPRLALGGLRTVGDTTPQCRAACARSRITCEAADGDCSPRWLTCLSSCAAIPSTQR